MKKLQHFLLPFLVIFLSCDPLVTEFGDIEDAIMYEAKTIVDTPAKDTIDVMTWNIRFGAARMPWFGDACGDRVILSDDEVLTNLENIANYLTETDPDIVFLQEVDRESKRTAYRDEAQWLLDHTPFNYAAYASIWQSQFIPSDGLGRMDLGNVILSKWPIKDAIRHPLPLRGDQDALVQLFYLRRNILEAKIEMGATTFYAVNIHATAFATDDTKQKHIRQYKELLDRIDAEGAAFISGGDLNSLPTTAVKTDYCLEDMCAGESFHQPGDDPEHKEGSLFSGQDLSPLYDSDYEPAVPLADYTADEAAYFTHTPDYDNPDGFDRKLDYLWTNRHWVPGSDRTHRAAKSYSDHLPVTARWEVGQ
ncbi:MAG: endonuclease/exonuclease/phosphatase family protein [Fidelibacterota bacterium]